MDNLDAKVCFQVNRLFYIHYKKYQISPIHWKQMV